MRAPSRLGGTSRPTVRRTGAVGGRLATALAALGLVVGAASGALADDRIPSEQEVSRADAAAQAAARTVGAVQADLAVANDQLHRSAEQAAQAAEAFNGARWQAHRAAAAVRAADRRAGLADADVGRQRAAYGDALATTYELSPRLQAFSAIVEADGIEAVIDQTYTLANAESAMSGTYDAYRAASTLATVASAQAETARQDAQAAQDAARTARDRARAAEATALATAQSIAQHKDGLVAELARLQGISVALAGQRQQALEQAASEAAAQAAQQQAAASSGPGPGGPPTDPTPTDPAPTAPSDPAPSDPAPSDDPPPAPDPTPPAPGSGATAAIAFARAQLGEPYRWGASGPNAWDCSGLTMGAWRAGGKSLPHYSVAQYQQSTPIAAGQLKPGDLVFWSSSSSPGSIFHVALYIGDGQIIHAPRTGRPVSQESMYYWTPPSFFARP